MGWVESGGRAEAGDWRLEAGGWRLEAGGSYGRIYASTQAAASGTSDEQQEEPASSGVEKRYALPLGNRAKQSQLGGQQAGGRRLEAGGSDGRIYTSTQAAPGGTRYEIRDTSDEIRDTSDEIRDTRYAACRWAIVRNKANFGVCGLPMGGRAGIMG